MTLPKDRKNPIKIVEDLLIIGTPVYYNQIPALIRPSLGRIAGNGQPAFLVAVYGNVSEGYALHQMDTIIAQQGFRVIGGASFIAEHSYSSETFAIAPGRPNSTDLEIARALGTDLLGKITTHDRIESIPKPIFKTPTNPLPNPNTDLAKQVAKQPSMDPDTCTNCKTCANNCPTSAIDYETLSINETLCIRCFACVKTCPNKARSIDLTFIRPFFKKAQKKQREPRIYL